jgi:hypothetical protein
MNERWKAALDRGLGNNKTRMLGLLLIAVGALGTVVLRNDANFETVFVATLVAGSVLGRWWTVLVPMAVLAIVEPVLWGGPYAFYSSQVVLGLTFFIVTGFLFVGIVGRSAKPRVLFRVGSVALLTLLSIPMTIAYDLWTDVGEYYFIAKPMGLTFWNVLEAQVPFTLYHLLSSLIFVPLFGSGILFLHTHGWPHAEEEIAPAEPSKE